jgi:hypothetical protein
MYDINMDLLDALRAGPAIFSALLNGCTEEQARTLRGGGEDWSVVEVVCHLRDAEERALERMRLMRDQANPFIAAYDQEEWAHERNYTAQDLRESFAAFVNFREQHAAELAALSPEAWERTGRHEEWGQITISAHTLHMASHDAIHAAQLARQLKS